MSSITKHSRFEPFLICIYLFISDWQQFVSDKLSAWRHTNLDWVHNFTGPTHVIFYDELVANVEHELQTLLKFLEFKVSKSELGCALERKEGIYRRKRRVISFDPYTTAMKDILKKEQELVYDAIQNRRSEIIR